MSFIIGQLYRLYDTYKELPQDEKPEPLIAIEMQPLEERQNSVLPAPPEPPEPPKHSAFLEYIHDLIENRVCLSTPGAQDVPTIMNTLKSQVSTIKQIVTLAFAALLGTLACAAVVSAVFYAAHWLIPIAACSGLLLLLAAGISGLAIKNIVNEQKLIYEEQRKLLSFWWNKTHVSLCDLEHKAITIRRDNNFPAYFCSRTLAWAKNIFADLIPHKNRDEISDEEKEELQRKFEQEFLEKMPEHLNSSLSDYLNL